MHPTLVPAKRLIANVEGAMNAVMVQGDAVGSTLYYGKGAGAEPTASAVIADLVDITRLHTADPDHRVPHLAFQPGSLQDTRILPIDEVVTAFYLRLQVKDQAGVLARITAILAESDISIDALLQRESAEGEAQTDVIILTHDTVEGPHEQGDRADAGAADRARADRAHPQGRAVVKYISTRGDKTERSFCEILLEGLAPDGGLYLPVAYPKVDAATFAKWRGLAYHELAFEILSLYIDDIPPADLRALVAKTYTKDVFGTPEIVPLRALEPGVYLEALSNGPTLAFKDMAMQLLGNLFEYELARRDQQLNILGATSGDTGSAAEYAMRGKRGVNVFMLSPKGRMSPFQQAQMFSLQDANIHNIAIEGVFDDCQDIVKAVSNDLAFKRALPHRHGQLDQLGALAGAGRLLLRRLLPGHALRSSMILREGHVRGAVGQLRQHLRRPCRADDGPADRAARARDQREQRARRVLPHRHLPRAQRGRDARDLQPVDGHLEGFELRALRLRSAGSRFRRARASCFARVERNGRSRSRPKSSRASRATASSRAAAPTPTGSRRSATPTERFGVVIDTHTADGLKVAREHTAAPGVPTIVLETALPAKFADTIVEAIGREPDRPAAMRRHREAAEALRGDAGRCRAKVKAFIAANT